MLEKANGSVIGNES